MHDSLGMDVQQRVEHSCHDTSGHAFRDGLSGDLLEEFTAFAQFEYQNVTVLVVVYLKQTSDVWMVKGYHYGHFLQ